MTSGGTGNRIKIGLIVDSTTVSKYVAELVDWSVRSGQSPITHLIVQKLPHQQRGAAMRERLRRIARRGPKKLMGALLWRAILWFERRAILRGPIADHLQMRDISELVPNQLIVTPVISQSGYVYRYSSDDIATLRSEQFNVLIRCGSGILRGEVLQIAADGVISFHHGDNSVNRGGPAAFWEAYRREAYTGFVIQRLTDELDGGEVLLRGRFPTSTFYMRNQANLFRRSNHYLIHLLDDYLAKGRLPDPEVRLPYSGPLYQLPNPAVSTRYLVRNVIDVCRSKAAYRVFRRRQVWGVSFVRTRWREAVLWRGHRVPAPKGHFFADPFVLSRNASDYCFVEDYDYRLGRGCISVLTLKEDCAELIGPAIVEPFHMSFPYIFEYDSKIYMVPETCKNHDIRVYEAEEFPSRWRLAVVAMTGVSAADTMIFRHGGHWWLFTNINPLGEEEHCSELMIYYSDNPIGSAWRPHAKNPIYIDPERARNGGLLVDSSETYRVAQVQGFNQYGAEARIFKIVELSPTTYREELETHLRPNFYPSLRGTHHMHANEHITVFDHVQ